MAVLARVNYIGQMRLDLHHMLAQESYTAFDFRAVISSLVGSDQTYVIRGLDVVGKTGLSINVSVSDAQVFNPKDPNGSMYLGLPDDLDEIIELPANQSNVYIEANFINQSRAPVNQGFWDALALTGDDAGGTEFTASANTQNVIVLEITANTVGFTEGAIPLAKASTGASTINSMEDRRPLMYRLGRGGSAPDPLFKYPFSATRVDPPLSGSGVGESDATSPWRSQDATGAVNDKGLKTFKDWADAVMTRISEISGSSLWYAAGGASSAVSNLSVSQVFFDSISGHSIQPSATSAFAWERTSGTLRLKGKGSVPLISGDYKDGLIRWQYNYGIIEWHLGATFVSGTHRSYSDVQFISPAPVDQGNVYLSLERDVQKGSGNNVSWADNSARGTFLSLRSVSGVAGDFTGIALGDYIRKESEGVSRYYRVAKMSDGSVDYVDTNPADRNRIADGSIVCLELHADIVGGASTEPLRFFRSRYANSDLVADAAAGVYAFQDANRYWLGRRVADLFILRAYGTMQEGEEITTLNDAFQNGSNGSDLVYRHAELAQYDASLGYQIKSGSEDLLTIYRRKRDNLIDSPSSGNNSNAILTYTIASPVGTMAIGDGLWVKLNDSAGGVLTAGSVVNASDDNNNTNTVTNVYEIRSQANSPLRNYDNRDVFLVARLLTVDGVPTLVFTDGDMVGPYGKMVNQDTDFRGNVRLVDAPVKAVLFTNETEAGEIDWDGTNFTFDPTAQELRVYNTLFGVNYIDQIISGNFSFLTNLGSNTLIIGGASSTTYIPGDLIVDGTTTSINIANLTVEDKLITLAIGVPLDGGFGSGIEIADDTRQVLNVTTVNTQSYVDLTYTAPHPYVLGDKVGVVSTQDVGGITAGQMSGDYIVVSSGSTQGDAEVISATVLRVWTNGTATGSTTSAVNPPRTYLAPFSIRLGGPDGTYSGLTSYIFRVKGVVTAPALTPVVNYGTVPTAHSINMVATRVPFVNDDNAGTAGADTTINFSSQFTWDNVTNTLSVTNFTTTGDLTIGALPVTSVLFINDTTPGLVDTDVTNFFYNETAGQAGIRNFRINDSAINVSGLTNIDLFAAMGARHLTVGEPLSTSHFIGDVLVRGKTASFSVSQLTTDDRVVTLGVGAGFQASGGTGIEFADNTLTATQVDTTSGQQYVDLTYISHPYVLGSVVGVVAIPSALTIPAGRISGEYTVVATGSVAGDAEVISPTVLRIWTGTNATTTATSVTNLPRSFEKPTSIRLGTSAGLYTGITSFVFQVKGTATKPTLTPVTDYGIVPTGHSVNMQATRLAFVNDDNAGPAAADTTLNFSANLTWDNVTNTLSATNLNVTNIIASSQYWTVDTVHTASFSIGLTNTIIPVDTSASVADLTATLPLANAAMVGRILVIKDVGGQCSQTNKRIILDGNGSDTIDGDLVYIMEADWESITLVCRAVGLWSII